MKPDLVYRWMTPSPYTLTPDDTIGHAQQLLEKHGIRHLPILDQGTLVGMVSERDIQVAELFAHVKNAKVEVVMSREPYAVHPSTPLAEVADEMARRRLGAAIVVDQGNVVGVFTAVDALRALAAERGREHAA